MKKLIIAISLLVTSLINAGWWGQKIGNFTYFSNPYGQTYTVQSIGNFDYVSGSNGYSGFGQKIGNFYYYSE